MSDAEQKLNLIKWIEQATEYYGPNVPLTLAELTAFLRQDGKVEKPTSKLKTIEVPYIPPVDGDIQSPEWFEEKVKNFGDIANIKDYELHEIIGDRLVYFEEDDSWVNVGHKAIYKLRESHDE